MCWKDTKKKYDPEMVESIRARYCRSSKGDWNVKDTLEGYALMARHRIAVVKRLSDALFIARARGDIVYLLQVVEELENKNGGSEHGTII